MYMNLVKNNEVGSSVYSPRSNRICRRKGSVEIPIRKQPSSLSPSGRLSKTRCAVSDDIHAIARTFKARMANAVSKMTGATATTTCNNEQPKEMAPSSGVVSYQLKNMELLKQYLIFLSLETTVRLEKQDNGNHAILIDPPNERLPHPGARLIESLVHNTPCKMSNTLEDHASRRRIHCICDHPTKDHGHLIQCNDCEHWLHFDCLDITKDMLPSKLTCPHCILALDSLGIQQHHHYQHHQTPLKRMAWRYAARYNSQRMAAMIDYSSSSEDDASDIDDDDGDMSSSTAISSEASTPEAFYYDASAATPNLLKASMDVLAAELSSSLCSGIED
ncbi:predicted protein [Lichtheimia corymbifera JMRC:FSU:9682]|uniref:PHD-type domain-containing protein n=1 Tax=Lichtheimia corymbifera JMRC:FSU:9682 TaxID=1263082 RepID=A0A068RFT2_9FUNG|nr:predicted protein [Lichtheimia corymbifera JMRC:FSU:9682]